MNYISQVFLLFLPAGQQQHFEIKVKKKRRKSIAENGKMCIEL